MSTRDQLAEPPRGIARTRWHDTALLVAPGLIWGASFLFIAEALTGFPPDGITFLRFSIGFAVLSLVPAARVTIRGGDHLAIGGLALVWMAFPMSLFPHAEQHVSSALTGMLNGGVPLIAALVAATIAWRAPSRVAWAGLGLGLLGGVLMAWPSLEQGGSTAYGIGLILVAIVSYGVGINLARPLQQRHGALPVVWRALAVSTIVTAPLGVPALFQAHWSARAMVSVVALGGLGTAAANVLMAAAAGRLGAVRASSTTLPHPGRCARAGRPGAPRTRPVTRHGRRAALPAWGCRAPAGMNPAAARPGFSA
jgi:drug/metabolite transporter (DMT)-like permease